MVQVLTAHLNVQLNCIKKQLAKVTHWLNIV